MVLNTIMVHDLLVCSAYQYQFSKNGTNVWKKNFTAERTFHYKGNNKCSYLIHNLR